MNGASFIPPLIISSGLSSMVWGSQGVRDETKSTQQAIHNSKKFTGIYIYIYSYNPKSGCGLTYNSHKLICCPAEA